MKLVNRLKKTRLWSILYPTIKRFTQIDGTEWAGAFAFDLFFSLFPLIILLVTIASEFIDREQAGTVIITNIQKFTPLSEGMQDSISNVIANVINARGEAGIIALAFLLWSSIRGIITLVLAVNRAWKAEECSWWRMPVKSIILLFSTAGIVLLSKWVAVMVRSGRGLISKWIDIPAWIYTLAGYLIPFVMLFFGLSLFYIYAPCRSTKFSKIWAAVLVITLFLQLAEALFVLYLANFSNFNALYGTLGGFMALLMWIYLSGIIFIFGACLCVTMAERNPGSVVKRDKK
jgi:YihY family inner membrane protein